MGTKSTELMAIFRLISKLNRYRFCKWRWILRDFKRHSKNFKIANLKGLERDIVKERKIGVNSKGP